MEEKGKEKKRIERAEEGSRLGLPGGALPPSATMAAVVASVFGRRRPERVEKRKESEREMSRHCSGAPSSLRHHGWPPSAAALLVRWRCELSKRMGKGRPLFACSGGPHRLTAVGVGEERKEGWK
jgi:hypothetical protein